VVISSDNSSRLKVFE